MNWWLYPKQNEFKHDFPTIGVCVVYVLVVIVCTGIRAFTWPGNKHVDSGFLVDAVVIPVAVVTFLVQVFCIAYNAHRHYIETRILIAARQEYKVVSYARRNIILAGWSILTPPKATKELALNMLKLEGEFPLAAKMPLKIDLDKSFDFTRAGQAIIHLLEPMMEKLSRYRQIEVLVWVRGGDESCSDELRRVLERSGISTKKITFLPECPDYTLVTEWIKQTNGYVVERLLICVDLHSEEGECKWMENATALLLTNYYVKTEGEKPVYLYQPMTGVIDVESAVPVYLRAEAVSKPKQIWYTGLSRTEKYPLLEVLDEKKVVPDRLELEMSLGEHSAGYPWLALALASDAVSYAQGDQFVAASEQKKFSITAVSSRLTHQPDYPAEKMYTPPWSSAGLSGMMLFFTVILTMFGFSVNEGEDISGGFLVILFVICTGLFTAAGVFITWLQSDKAYQHMGM
ncbi:hypothetical protein KWI07_02645 [Enterobacter bugandensis]|uniref:hypothetical protein n=1 Tax=Enterobacter bugandensis TaxID=881260 RepID=UPI0021CF772F|nr:hypothetical protein [Enterobacter bugandensis]MCU6159316.1 hypothetical protein [Enterobacter bugandensis]